MAITNRHLMILVLMCNYFLFGLLLNSVGIVILQSINSFGVSKENAALLEGFKDLPIAIVSFFVASLLPRLGYRKAMLIAVALVLLACLAMPVIASFWATKLFFLCVGSAFALIKVSVYASVGLLTNSKQNHASLLNSIEGIFMCGVLSGYWIFSVFIDDQNPASSAWLNVYWLIAGLCAFNLLLMFAVKFDDRPATDSTTELTTEPTSKLTTVPTTNTNPASPITSPFEDFIAMLKLVLRPLVYSFMGAMFLYVLIEQGIGTWLPTFNSEVLRLPASIAVQITSLFALSLALGRLGAGWLLRFIPWHLFLAGCILAMATLVILTLPLAHNVEAKADSHWFNLPLAAYIFPLIGLFMAPIYPLLNSLVLSSLPQRQQSSMTGLIIIFSALGGTTGSIITGTVFNQFSGQTAFYLALVPMACIFLLIFQLKRTSI